MSSFERLLAATPMLGEGSLYERLRREPAVQFDDHVAHATLVYDDAARAVLERTHREYLDIGQAHGVPMLTATDTWRANRERQDRSPFRAHPVNGDNVRFMQDLRASYGAGAAPIMIGGSIGPRGDAYRPQEALDREVAAAFHAPQVAALAEAGPDYLIAEHPARGQRGARHRRRVRGHRPAVHRQLRRAARRHGLDGTPLRRAIETIDAATSSAPAGYGINCTHPSAVGGALDATGDAAERVVYYQANASALGPDELDGRDELDADDPDALAAAMHEVRIRFGIRALGGCCGTDGAHRGARPHLRAGRPMKVARRARRVARVAVHDVRGTASLGDFVRLLRIRLAHVPVANVVAPRAGEAVVNVRGVGPVVLRSGTSDVYVVSELLDGDSYDGLPLHAPADVRLVLDLGANTGLVTRWLLARFPRARVIAVEPDPVTCAVLRRNVANQPRAIVIEAGVGARPGVPECPATATRSAGASSRPTPARSRCSPSRSCWSARTSTSRRRSTC